MSPRRNLRARSVAVAALLLVGRASAFLPQTPIRYPYVSVHGCLVLRDGASLSSRSRTRRYMVADIADSVAEKASTETLMDLILDESLRSSARKPIIMEYDPSSKAVGILVSTRHASFDTKAWSHFFSLHVRIPIDTDRSGNTGREPYLRKLGGRLPSTLFGLLQSTSYFSVTQRPSSFSRTFTGSGGKC